MNIVLIANIISFVGAVIMVVSGLLKTKRTILIAQNIQFAIQAVGNILLGGYSGAAINLISIVRNVFLRVRAVHMGVEARVHRRAGRADHLGQRHRRDRSAAAGCRVHFYDFS